MTNAKKKQISPLRYEMTTLKILEDGTIPQSKSPAIKPGSKTLRTDI